MSIPFFDLGQINPQDPNEIRKILERLAALEKAVKELPDTLPPAPGFASATKRGLLDKDNFAKLANATSVATANALVQRDGSGNAAFNTITLGGAAIGNADVAKLATYPSTRGHVEAYQSANIARASGTIYDFVTDNETRDTNGEWNGATATFTSGRAGVFLVAAQVLIITPPDQSRVFVQVTDTANVELFRVDDQTQSGTAGDLRGFVVLPIYFGAAGGQFKIRFGTSNPAVSSQTSRGGASFMWVKIREIP